MITSLFILGSMLVIIGILQSNHAREADVARQLIELQYRQIEELRKEAHALRIAMFPQLGKIDGYEVGRRIGDQLKKAAQDTKPAATTPAVNMRQPWRQLKKILEAQHNTKQRQHDNLVAGIQKAQERPNA